jgi:hypothetical protein
MCLKIQVLLRLQSTPNAKLHQICPLSEQEALETVAWIKNVNQCEKKFLWFFSHF